MALLSLKDIGKIYVSDGNVAVGIRGVNLSFERGEFVAVTGKSGSGKSTLLNVISGMDSYEEGELYIEEQPTSHYLQPEWEEYREKYISFIFQDYNIIESFTVLQNVELALMHIEDKKERRRRALELINRVGLTSHIKHKGSKLSGGQKQRTVIARALAKDSPIILADEPTGNLDSATSKEIINLLYEVSRDKLLIIVTHNFEEVEERATRHIRIFDGAVESDHQIVPQKEQAENKPVKKQSFTEKTKTHIKNGLTLGSAIFFSKPKLSFFLCMLMIVGTLGIFFMTASSGDAAYIFEKHYMFRHIDGRLVITKQSGETISDKELEVISEKYGAKSYLHYDILLDMGDSAKVYFDNNGKTESEKFICTYGESFGEDIIGKYPSNDNEVLLYLPISYQPIFGKNEIKTNKVYFAQTELEVTGIKYYYDNNQDPRCLFTEGGFRIATSAYYLINNSSINATVNVVYQNSAKQWNYSSVSPSFNVEKRKMYITDKNFTSVITHLDDTAAITVTLTSYPSFGYDYDFEDIGDISDLLSGTMSDLMSSNKILTKIFAGGYISEKAPEAVYLTSNGYTEPQIAICPYLMTDFVEEFLEKSYSQASLFFENDQEAHAVVDGLMAEGYIPVPSDTTYTPDGFTTIISMFSAVMTAVMWIVSIVFFAFVINLCSARALDAFKSDMAIMRSMGISVKVIRIGMYVRMLIALAPAYILVIISAVLVFTVPKFNAMFTYLYFWQYIAIFIGMLILTFRTTRKQVKRLFGESVKKSLKGGNNQ